jgi:hypothetical protein
MPRALTWRNTPAVLARTRICSGSRAAAPGIEVTVAEVFG